MIKPVYNFSGAGKDVLTGSERILLVDDEKLLTRMWENILGRIGYKITAMNSPDEAIKLFKAAPDDFDLVITDLSMPEMTGDMLSRAILSIRPGMPVILCTGYASRVEKDPSISACFTKVIYKPAKIAELTAAIREALAAKQN